jgi:hypothetical protein
MDVRVPEPRHDRLGGGVHEAAAPVSARPVGPHSRDAVAPDLDVDVPLEGTADAVPQRSGVDHKAPGGRGAPPSEPQRDGARLAAGDVHQAQPPVRQVEKLTRVAAEARGADDLAGDQARRPRGLTAGVHRHDPETTLDHECHLAPVGRPDRAGVDAVAERLEGDRVDVTGRAGSEVERQDLAGSLAEARRVGLERRERERVAVRTPAGRSRLPHRIEDLPYGARGDSDRLGRAVLVLEGDLRAVRRPGRRDLSPGEGGQPSLGARFEVSHVHVLASPSVRRVAEIATVARESGVGLEIRVVGQPPWPPTDPHQPEIVQRGKGDAARVGREHGRDDPLRALPAPRVEVVPLGPVGGPLEREPRLEGHAVHCPARELAPQDLPVGRVDQRVRREPLGGEGEDVLVAADPLSGDHQRGLVGAEERVRDPLPVRRPGRGGDPPLVLADHRPAAPGGIDRVDPARRQLGRLTELVPGRVDPLGGDEGNLQAVGRPGRLVLLVRAVGAARELAGGQLQHPDVVAAAAIRREGDAGPVGREPRLAVVVLPEGQLSPPGAVRSHRPDVIVAALVGLERDRLAVRRPIRHSRVGEVVGDPGGASPARRKSPEDSLQVHHERLPVGGEGDRDVRAAGERDAGRLAFPALARTRRGQRERDHRRQQRRCEHNAGGFEPQQQGAPLRPCSPSLMASGALTPTRSASTRRPRGRKLPTAGARTSRVVAYEGCCGTFEWRG